MRIIPVGFYLLLCLITLLAGKGVLQLIKLPLTPLLSLTLSPMLTLSLWTIGLGWGVLLGYPVKHLWEILWLITLFFSSLGLLSFFREPDFRNRKKLFWLILLLLFLLPIIVMAPYFWHGLLNYGGANAADGWSYVAVGQYLWENSRGTDGQLSPLYQYATHLSHTRFISSALLGFLSPFVNHPGDSQSVANLLLAWNIFNLTAACAFFCLTQHNIKFLPIYLILVIFSGWMLGLLSVNNFDNALILPLLPTFAGMMYLITHSKKWSLIFSLLISSALFCYMELAPFIFGGTFFLFITYSLSQQNKKNILIQILFIFLLTLFFTLPYLTEAIPFLINQFHSTTDLFGERPGEGFFHALKEPREVLAAFWGNKSNLVGNFLGAIFSGLTCYGLFLLWREKKRALSFLCIFLLSGSIYFILKQHYSYGAYKLILLNWWLLMFCVIKAIQHLLSIIRYRTSLTILFSFFFIVYLGNTYSLQHYYAKYTPIKDIRSYRELTAIKKIVADKAILVDIQKKNAYLWAVYFLRDYPIQLKVYQSYLNGPHVRPYMDKVKLVNRHDIGFLLTDSSENIAKLQLVWSSEPYYLWKLPNN